MFELTCYLKYSVGFFLCILFGLNSNSQNEAKQWCFGNTGGLSFMTNPPTSFTSSINTFEGSASIADGAGNLLFYTDGITVWNRLHAVMANGTGLLGHPSSTQSGIIVKRPGSTNLYFIFTLGAFIGPLNYTIVDMNLAAGNGSVTIKNVLMATNMTEQITAIPHCNGSDIWILTHKNSTADFQSYLLTSAGLNSVPVISSVTFPTGNGYGGYLKASPNGKKIGLANAISGSFHLYDFDSNNGTVSNLIVLGTIFSTAYGCEFSTDGTKLYGTKELNDPAIYQWDICQSSSLAIIASQNTVGLVTGVVRIGALQLATNGKIYISRYGTNTLGVINNPNTYGASCNYVNLGQSAGTATCNMGLPNFIPKYFRTSPASFSYTIGSLPTCHNTTFTAPPVAQTATVIGCAASGYSFTNLSWDFGDPSSGVANSSTLSNPVHVYNTVGTYSAQLILHYSCGGGTDTLYQIININQLCIYVISSSISCSSLGSATAIASGGNGPYTYTWMPGNLNGLLVSGLSPGVYSITAADAGSSVVTTATVLLSSGIPFSGSLNVTNSLVCGNAQNGSATISNINGGSGTQSYIWLSNTGTLSGATVFSLGAGSWTVKVTDHLTGCSFQYSFQVQSLPVPSLSLSPANPKFCIGTGINLKASGTGNTYQWIPSTGLNTNTGANVIASSSSSQTYTVITSLGTCTNAAQITVTVLPLPVVSISVSQKNYCVRDTIVLNGFGGKNYSWLGPGNQNFSTRTVSFSISSTSLTGIYTLTATDENGCSNTATSQVSIGELPEGVFSGSGTKDCVPFNLVLTGSSGSSLVTLSWVMDKQIYNTQKFFYYFTSPGDYTISGTFLDTVSKCKNSEAFVVNALPKPQADFNFIPSRPIENSETVIFMNNSSGVKQVKWNWHINNNEGYTSNLQNTSFYFKEAGAYPVALVVTNAYGCVDTVVKSVLVEEDFLIYVPDAFSPNGDELNDIFLPIMRGVKSYQLTIFDRWGEILFNTKDPIVAWDGNYKGKLCAFDVYNWLIEVNGSQGQIKKLKGHVTLLNR